jgi:hypothetical protein
LNIFSMTLYHWGAHKQSTYNRKRNGGLEGFFKALDEIGYKDFLSVEFGPLNTTVIY